MVLSFRTRILAALVFVIAGVLAPIFVVVYSAIRASMIEHAQVTQETGARVLGESMRERDAQLLYAARQAASDAVIVKSTIDLGHNMGLRVVAEGVENEESLKLLQGYSCDMAQGFLISKPLPLAEFIEWFRQYEQTPAAGAPAAAEAPRIKAI